MRVFIENEAGSSRKHSYDERTLSYLGTAAVAWPYPYPYGFVVGTRAEDGDAVDCFVLTTASLRPGATIDAEPVGLLEQIEDGEVDHKVLAVLRGETVVIDDAVLARLTEFANNVFAHVPGKRMRVGRLLNADAARAHVEAHRE